MNKPFSWRRFVAPDRKPPCGPSARDVPTETALRMAAGTHCWLACALLLAGIGGQSATAAPQAGEPAAEASSSDGNDWPVFRQNIRGTGVAPMALRPPLDVAWRYRFEDSAIEATAVIAGDVVYVGDMEGTFVALDLHTGHQKWVDRGEAGYVAAAAVDEDLVVVADFDGVVRGLDTASGRRRWSFATNAEVDGGANFYQDHVLVGSQDASLYCLQKTTGTLAWKVTTADQIRCAPTVADGHAFLAGCDGYLHVIDVNQGEEVRRVEIQSPTGSTPAAQDELVYFGTEGGVFFAVDWRKGAVTWTASDPRRMQSIRSSAAVRGNRVVYGARDKRVHARHATTGQTIWNFSTRGQVDSSPAISGQFVLVGSSDGRLYMLSLVDGSDVWKYDAGGAFSASPAVARNCVVIGNEDGTLYCFRGE